MQTIIAGPSQKHFLFLEYKKCSLEDTFVCPHSSNGDCFKIQLSIIFEGFDALSFWLRYSLSLYFQAKEQKKEIVI